MSHPSPEQLGPPSVRLKAFQLWVHGRQFPEAQDQWDGNWLNVTVHCGQSGASVWATGAILDSIGLVRFRNDLERLHQSLSGEAVLESHEPNVELRVASSDGAGHLLVRAEITPDHLAQGQPGLLMRSDDCRRDDDLRCEGAAYPAERRFAAKPDNAGDCRHVYSVEIGLPPMRPLTAKF